MRNKSLLTKVAAISLVMAAFSMIISGIVFFTLFYNRARANMEITLKNQGSAACNQLIRYQSIDWLLQYWHEHYAEMSLPPFESVESYADWSNERGEFYRINSAAFTTEEALKLSEEKQRLFAEYCYVQIYLELAMCRYNAGLDSLCCFFPNETGEGSFLYFLNTKDDLSTMLLDQEVPLGNSRDIKPAAHPELIKLMSSESEIMSGIEIYHSEEDGNDYASIYEVVGRDPKTRGILSLTISIKDMMAEVWSDVFEFEKWLVPVILIAFSLLLLTVYLSSLKPTLKLAEVIRSYTVERSADKLSGDLKGLISRGDEIGRLALDVREMVYKIDLYYLQEIENEKLRIKNLVAQIKPHFIYNCLSAIRSLMDEPEKAEEALTHFAGFLRGVMDILEETGSISAEKEFETVDHYLFMEKLRFEDRLNIVKELNDRDFFLPAFSVQVLTENAVNHGIGGTKRGCGTVCIRSYEADGFHVIEVQDDGEGIPCEKGGAYIQEEGIHIGLQNIEKRLQLMCEGTLTIESEQGKGTLATIRIPK